MIVTSTTLGEHVETQKGFAFKSEWFCESGRPIVKVKDFTANSVDVSSLSHVSEEIAEKHLRYELRTGDVVIQTVGSWPTNPASVVGKCVRMPQSATRSLLNQNAVRLKPLAQLDGDYLYYALKSPEFSEYIVGTAQGAASQAAITLDAIRSYKLPLPDLPTQRQIAGILSAYDDLIENNLRRIRILEEMAQSLYREWFVHFRFPGHESVPLIDSPLGPIPQGWKVKKLNELATIKGGKQLAKPEIKELGDFPVYGGNGIQGYAARSTHSGFVIPFGRVGANCGAIHWTYDGAWLNNNSSSIVPVGNDELILGHLLEFNFVNLRGGAAQPFISNSALSAIELVTPPALEAEKFCSIVRTMRLEQINLIERNRTLRQTRDLLLPKLLSVEQFIK